MAKVYDLIYMDSCVIFDCLQRKPEFFPHVEPILRDAIAEKLNIVVSTICYAEVLLLKGDPQGQAKIDNFFNQEFVNVYDVDDVVA